MGNRFQGGISPGAMPFMHRFVGNPMLSALGRRFYDHKVCGDFYCGLRGFRKEAIQSLRLQSREMEFALEMIIKAELNALKIPEVPTTLSPDGRDRKPHLKTYRDGWRSLRFYLLMSPRWSFGIPGLLASTLGLLAFFVAGTGWLGASLSPLLPIAGCGLTVVGYQAFLLAIFAKFVAIESGLHPPLTKFARLREHGVVEEFLVAGVLLAIFSRAFCVWVSIQSATGLPAFLAVTALCISGQTILAGLYFGILGLLIERRQFPRKRRGD